MAISLKEYEKNLRQGNSFRFKRILYWTLGKVLKDGPVGTIGEERTRYNIIAGTLKKAESQLEHERDHMRANLRFLGTSLVELREALVLCRGRRLRAAQKERTRGVWVEARSKERSDAQKQSDYRDLSEKSRTNMRPDSRTAIGLKNDR